MRRGAAHECAPGNRCSLGPRCQGGPPAGGLAAAALCCTRVRAFPMPAAAEAQWLSDGMDPHGADGHVATLLSCVHYILPDPPFVSAHGAAALTPPPQGYDLISGLPDVLLRRIVNRLPVKDGARTAALSRRWRGVWRSAPLVFLDADLLPVRSGWDPDAARADARRAASAVTRILAAHPGPFRCVHLISTNLEEIPGMLRHWLQLLAVKGVRELILVSRPWPLEMDLPPTFFGMATLTRLCLGFFRFPDTAGLPHAVQFPHLRELGLFSVPMERQDMDFVLARCPVLESLCLLATFVIKRLRLVSNSLRCLQIIESRDLNIIVKDTPRLERLIIWSSSVCDGVPRRVKIGHCPTLSLVGYLQPALHVLEVGNTIIKAGTSASPSTMVPSVKILGIKVCFGVRNDAKMLPGFLRCFPNVERLHLESYETDEPTGKLNNKFWQEAGAIECVQSHIKLLIFYGFRGERSELSFLKFFLESASMLTKLVIVVSKGSFTSMAEANSRVKPLLAAKRASPNSLLLLFESAFESGEDRWLLNFRRGSDFSTVDPLACTAALQGCNF